MTAPILLGRATLHLGDCLEVLRTLPDASIEAIVTDPPYGLAFMGKHWDYDVPTVEVWQECLRVLKPGGHLLAFAGTRTFHRMAVRIEDAGFEIRDMIAWVYGSGFPKSTDVSKQIDQQEKHSWIKISKAIDSANLSEISELWINSKNANAAGLSFQRKVTEAGLNTQKSGFAHGSVLLQASHKNCDALAVIAELNLTEARPTSAEVCSSAQSNAESIITTLKSHAITAENSQENREATQCMVDFSALQRAWGWRGESKEGKLKAVEALKTWLGSKPSSRQEATDALCAALTDDLKLITLSQSKTFLSFDTTRQMACASAISATITESTAESLISFTADTLKSKAIDKAAGAEREVLGRRVDGRYAYGFTDAAKKAMGAVVANASSGFSGEMGVITAPATDAARQWSGWGTALKPALEPIALCRKPLDGTVSKNVLAHGTGAINIDGCKVSAERNRPKIVSDRRNGNGVYRNGLQGSRCEGTTDAGRFPANLIHDGSDEVVALFPQSTSGFLPAGTIRNCENHVYGLGMASAGKPACLRDFGGDTGSAARFFYCAKADKSDRDEGLDGFEQRACGIMEDDNYDIKTGSGNSRDTRRRNHHPTVKPTDLMRYLCRLVTPPGGTILDPFMGSGSTGRGAALEGFRFIGIEREADYLAIAQARIKAAQRQPDLFHPEAVAS